MQGLLTMARGGVRRAVTYLGLAMGVALMTGRVAGLVSHEGTTRSLIGMTGRTEPSLPDTGQRSPMRQVRRTTPVGARGRRETPQLRIGSPALMPSVGEQLIARPRLLGRRYRAEFCRDRPRDGEHAAGRRAQDVAVTT